jgi:predicted Zn-dependent protease
VILAVFSGDVSGAGDMGIGLGSLLVTTGYSRKFESEADAFAFEHMLKAGIDPTAFATIMDKITRFDPDYEASPSIEKSGNSGWSDYLSTHPNTRERISLAKQYAQCFRDGLLKCSPVLNAVD